MVDTRASLAILGYRKDGRPIYEIRGGADDGQGGDGGGGQDDAGDKGAAAGAAGGQSGDQQQAAGPFDHITDPAELRALAVRLTNEAAQSRTKSRDQVKTQAAADATKELTDKIAEALGLKGKAENPDDLKRQIAGLQAANLDRDRELSIYRAALAPGMNVDAGRLLDSRSFMQSLRDIDPNGDDAAAKITEKINAAVSSDPSLKTVRVNGGGSVGHAGGAGDHTTPDLSKMHGTALMEAAYAASSSKG